MRVVLYTGKGGVGKTTTAAATGIHGASLGLRTLVASADAAHSLGDVLERRLGHEPTRIDLEAAGGAQASGLLDAVEVDVRHETERHWGSVRDYLVRLFRHQGIEPSVADELALLPGAEEITTLLAVEAAARDGDYELVIVDCAPTDAALRLLTLPEVARGAVRTLLKLQRALAQVATPIANALVSLPLPEAAVFRDAEALLYPKLRRLRRFVTRDETTTRLVLTPDRMVIDEARRAWTDLALFELPCDAVVMNRLLPEGAAAEPFFRDWGRLQEERLEEVRDGFAPLPVLEARLQDDEATGVERLRALGAELFEAREPDAILCRSQGLRFDRTSDGFVARIPVARADASELDVAKLDAELWITTATRRRAIPLPRHLVGFELGSARLESGALAVELRAPEGAS